MEKISNQIEFYRRKPTNSISSFIKSKHLSKISSYWYDQTNKILYVLGVEEDQLSHSYFNLYLIPLNNENYALYKESISVFFCELKFMESENGEDSYWYLQITINSNLNETEQSLANVCFNGVQSYKNLFNQNVFPLMKYTSEDQGGKLSKTIEKKLNGYIKNNHLKLSTVLKSSSNI